MIKLALRLLVTLTAVAVGAVGLAVPAQAAPPPMTAAVSSAPTKPRPAVQRMTWDWKWTHVEVWYNKYETQRIVATNGACSVVVGKAPGWIANILSGSCGLIAVWAGYALARGRCVGLDVSYAMAIPYNWKTRAC